MKNNIRDGKETRDLTIEGLDWIAIHCKNELSENDFEVLKAAHGIILMKIKVFGSSDHGNYRITSLFQNKTLHSGLNFNHEEFSCCYCSRILSHPGTTDYDFFKSIIFHLEEHLLEQKTNLAHIKHISMNIKQRNDRIDRLALENELYAVLTKYELQE